MWLKFPLNNDFYAGEQTNDQCASSLGINGLIIFL